MSPEKIVEAQRYLKERRLDGWLVYDFHRCNELAHQFLSIAPGAMSTRRFFYWIPVEGKPIKLVHAIEARALDHAPGEKRVYSSWQSLEKELGQILQGARRVAMEYSPRNAIPYVSKVDGGTVDLVRSFGIEVVSSADFLLFFTALLDDAQMESQRRAARGCQETVEGAWNWIGSHLKKGITNWDVLEWIRGEFKRRELESDEPPIVAVNEQSADPHFSTERKSAKKLAWGDFILIDLWAKEKHERAVFGDLTRVAVVGEASERHREIFQIVRNAQTAVIDLIRSKKGVLGWEADEAARTVIRDAGYGEFFIHRTGHNIGVQLHGNGTHLDNLEMHDVRPLLPRTCFSVEPGIYLPGEFGVRLESDILIHADGRVEVTGSEEDVLKVLIEN